MTRPRHRPPLILSSSAPIFSPSSRPYLEQHQPTSNQYSIMNSTSVLRVLQAKEQASSISPRGGTRSKARLSFIYTPSQLPILTDDMPPPFSYHLTTHLAYTPSNSTTLALIKRGPTLDPITPLATQLHILNLFGGEETPYESLHAVVSNGVKPWFDAFVGARGQGKDGDNKMGKSFSRLCTHGETHVIGVYCPRRKCSRRVHSLLPRINRTPCP